MLSLKKHTVTYSIIILISVTIQFFRQFYSRVSRRVYIWTELRHSCCESASISRVKEGSAKERAYKRLKNH